MTSTNIDKISYREYVLSDNGMIKYSDAPNTHIEEVDKTFRALFIDGNIIKNAEIITKESRTLVPVRIVSENLGAKVSWNAKTKTVTINNDKTKIDLTIGKNIVKVNDAPQNLDVAPIIHNDKTYLPIRFVTENLGANVSYFDGLDETKPYIFYKIPQILIDSIKDKQISKDEAIKNIKENYTTGYKKIFNKDISSNKGLDKEFENIKYINETPRYYRFNFMYNILFDKYTGDMYREFLGFTITIDKIDFDNKSFYVVEY